MTVLLTCKDEEHTIKTEGARVLKTLNGDFQTLKGSSILVTCKNEEDPFRNEGAREVSTLLPGQLTPWSDLAEC